MFLQSEQPNDESIVMEAISLIRNRKSANKYQHKGEERSYFHNLYLVGKKVRKLEIIWAWSHWSSSYLWLIVCSQQNVGGLDVSVNYPALAAFMEIMEASGSPDCNIIPYGPVQLESILIYRWKTMVYDDPIDQINQRDIKRLPWWS